MKKEILQTKINFEQYAEDVEPEHPFEDLDFDQIKKHIIEIEKKYPNHKNFYYEKDWESLRYGAMIAWYDLIGYEKE